jgi:hypothetical protein
MKTAVEGEDFEFDGIQIWKHKWQAIGEKISVKDPVYNQEKNMDVYEIVAETKKLKFAAGEFSNGVRGFYLDNIIVRD